MSLGKHLKNCQYCPVACAIFNKLASLEATLVRNSVGMKKWSPFLVSDTQSPIFWYSKLGTDILLVIPKMGSGPRVGEGGGATNLLLFKNSETIQKTIPLYKYFVTWSSGKLIHWYLLEMLDEVIKRLSINIWLHRYGRRKQMASFGVGCVLLIDGGLRSGRLISFQPQHSFLPKLQHTKYFGIV